MAGGRVRLADTVKDRPRALLLLLWRTFSTHTSASTHVVWNEADAISVDPRLQPETRIHTDEVNFTIG